MIEDKRLKRQFTVKDQVGSLKMSAENMMDHLDLNPNRVETSLPQVEGANPTAPVYSKPPNFEFF